MELRLIVLGDVKTLESGADLIGATKIPKRAGTGFSRVIFASEVPAAPFIPMVYLASFFSPFSSPSEPDDRARLEVLSTEKGEG